MAHGFRTVNANGSIGIDSTETACRFVAQVAFLRNFNGTISVPDFDINRGGYTVTMTNVKYNNAFFGDGQDDKSNRPPTTSWNNSTKLLSVTTYSSTMSDWRVLFLHYK
jgi:hypothetical protein